MPELPITTLPEAQADTPAQVTFSLALMEELFTDPGRIGDPAFAGYLVGLFDGEGSTARDQFAAVTVLGFDATISAMYGGNQDKYLNGGDVVQVPEGLAMPPRLAGGFAPHIVFQRDHERDKAARIRLLTGHHVGPVDEARLTVGMAVTNSFAALELPKNVCANLLTVAAFLKWMLGDKESATVNITLAMLADPDNKLAPLLAGMFQDHEPHWREAQAARNEVI